MPSFLKEGRLFDLETILYAQKTGANFHGSTRVVDYGPIAGGDAFCSFFTFGLYDCYGSGGAFLFGPISKA